LSPACPGVLVLWRNGAGQRPTGQGMGDAN